MTALRDKGILGCSGENTEKLPELLLRQTPDIQSVGLDSSSGPSNSTASSCIHALLSYTFSLHFQVFLQELDPVPSFSPGVLI